MNGSQLKKLRADNKWSQDRLNVVLQEALGHRYGSTAISRWERDTAKIPREVEAFLESLVLGSLGDPGDDTPQAAQDGLSGDDSPRRADDEAPPPPPGQQPFTSPTGGALQRACTELWEIIGTSVSLSGSLIGSEAIVRDGQVITADSKALGAAYGKLAETNETFRTMLIGMTQGGAWLEVAVVTGSTVAKIAQNHYTPPEQQEDNGRAPAPDLSLA